MVLTDSGPITVAAGNTKQIDFDDPGDRVYCRFVKASKSKVRAALTTFVNTDDGTDHVVAVAQ